MILPTTTVGILFATWAIRKRLDYVNMVGGNLFLP